jgi:hypothetical protein
MSADVAWTGTSGKTSTFTLTLKDNTTDQTFQISESIRGAKLNSAEWVQEAPSGNNGILRLSNFGQITFTNAQATIGGETGVINDSNWQSEGDTVYQMNMVNRKGSASTSALNAAGNSFTVAYGGSTPAAPSNSSVHSVNHGPLQFSVVLPVNNSVLGSFLSANNSASTPTQTSSGLPTSTTLAPNRGLFTDGSSSTPTQTTSAFTVTSTFAVQAANTASTISPTAKPLDLSSTTGGSTLVEQPDSSPALPPRAPVPEADPLPGETAFEAEGIAHFDSGLLGQANSSATWTSPDSEQVALVNRVFTADEPRALEAGLLLGAVAFYSTAPRDDRRATVPSRRPRTE